MLLTRYNHHLSEPKNEVEIASGEAYSGLAEAHELSPEVLDYVRDSRATNTRRAYASDLQHFMAWGGTIPASPEQVASYIAAHADHLAPSSLNRRLASIAVAHGAKGYPSSTSSELVRSVLKGIRRTKGTAQAQAKPLLRDDLFIVLDAIGDSLKDVRDRALLLLGFAGGFRRSELVGLNIADLEFVRHGLIVNLRHSKTDQVSKGRKIGIPHGRTKHCPVKAVEAWLQRASLSEGAIFRPINRHSYKALQRLSGEAVAVIIRERITKAEINSAGCSGHSLRSGFATSAAMAGVATWRIRKQTGHSSDVMLGRYIRDGELFSENAAGAIL
jgi:integrase